MLNEIKKDAQARMAKSIESLRHNLVKVRTGRANTGLVDSIKVNYYGSDMPLSQVASVAVGDARSIIITPWEKQMVGAVEKAILASDLGLTRRDRFTASFAHDVTHAGGYLVIGAAAAATVST